MRAFGSCKGGGAVFSVRLCSLQNGRGAPWCSRPLCKNNILLKWDAQEIVPYKLNGAFVFYGKKDYVDTFSQAPPRPCHPERTTSWER